MEELNQYYEILGLRLGASPEEVKHAYRDLVKVWHPDRFPNDPRLQQKAQERLKEINNAYERLRSVPAGPHVEASSSEPQAQQQKRGPDTSEREAEPRIKSATAKLTYTPPVW
ncbi:MAG: J domain-containing protein [candidate division NC10 bacterium]|nr:J domain-containing protein [candidate division NC10 bacterium]